MFRGLAIPNLASVFDNEAALAAELYLTDTLEVTGTSPLWPPLSIPNIWRPVLIK